MVGIEVGIVVGIEVGTYVGGGTEGLEVEGVDVGRGVG